MATSLGLLGAKLPTNGLGGIGLEGGAIKVVNVNMRNVSLLYKVFSKNPMVSTALAQFMRTVLRSSLVINIEHEDGSVEPFDITNGRNQRYYNKEIYPAIKKMCEEWILYGFTCVSIGRSNVIDGAPTLIVLPITEYQCQINYDDEFRRSYKISFNTAVASKRTQNLAKNALFLCMHEPDDAGELTSPVARCLLRLVYYEKLWHDKVRESHLRTHPPLVFTQETISSGARLRGAEDAVVSDVFSLSGQAPTSVVKKMSEEARHKYMQDQTNEAFENRRQLAAISSRMVAASIPDSSSLSSSSMASSSSSLKLGSSALLFNFRELSEFTDGDDPVTNQFVAPPGQKFERTPAFDGVEAFRDIMAMIDENFFNALGLPIENHVYKTEKGMELMLKKLNTSVIHFHRDAAMLIAEALEPVLKLQLLPEVGERVAIKHSDEPSDSGGDDSDSSDDDDSESPLKKRVKDAFINTSIQVSFQTMPETTMDLLTKLRDTDVIRRGMFKKLARDFADITTPEENENEDNGDDLYHSEYEDRRAEKRQRFTESLREPPAKSARTPNDSQ